MIFLWALVFVFIAVVLTWFWTSIGFMAHATRFEVKDGWLHVNGNSIHLVEQIKMVKGLKYKYEKSAGLYYDEHEVVMVTNKVGKLVELYLHTDNYADMELHEFLLRINGKTYEQ